MDVSRADLAARANASAGSVVDTSEDVKAVDRTKSSVDSTGDYLS